MFTFGCGFYFCFDTSTPKIIDCFRKIFTYGNEINLGRPPRTLTSAASRDLIMLPHRAVRHYWRWGDGIRSDLEPHWIAATVWYLLYGVIWYSINIYRGSLVIRKKIDKLSGESKVVSGYGVVAGNDLIQWMWPHNDVIKWKHFSRY